MNGPRVVAVLFAAYVAAALVPAYVLARWLGVNPWSGPGVLFALVLAVLLVALLAARRYRS